ncbi:YdgA family protein [Neorhizobium galegae]|uniref:Transmembrane protein n=1 Tax=Neorhizobium galegae bv. orientalis str. HAMBI 540 TaxID=1028800 RepID=A0A068SNF7_NEOGA|nr:hypothetical protein [Neorhizobium galegae]CDN47301.1 Hypothetical protein RG540_CH11130 [Neorhizobium galegae bv. orientalis str. HAMBI 540]
MQYSTKARLLLAGAALSTFAGPAFALDGNDLVTKINGALSIQGGAGFSAEKATVSGSNVTLTNAKLLVQAGKQNLPLGTVKFEGVEENNGGYTVEKVTFDNVNTSQDKTVFTASDIAISGLTVPGNPSGDGLDAIMLYDEAHVGKMTATVDGKQAFSVDGVNLTTEVADDSSSVGFDLQVNGVKSDLSLVDDAQAKDTLQQLGVTSIDGKVNMTGSWTLADGNLEIDEYAIDFAKVGKLNLAFSVSGYTLDFIKSANETAKAMEANPNKEQAQQAAGLAMLGLMQRLTFNSAEIRFEDAGITKKALDYAGKSQGTTGEAMAQMLKGMTPMMLAQYNVPELQNMVSAAVNSYLDKPGSFTITAEPADAVPFPMIMGAAMGAPNTLPKVLGVKVTAND